MFLNLNGKFYACYFYPLTGYAPSLNIETAAALERKKVLNWYYPLMVYNEKRADGIMCLTQSPEGIFHG
jgi:hypothetical protein